MTSHVTSQPISRYPIKSISYGNARERDCLGRREHLLDAFSAANLGSELYNSNQAAGGCDHFGCGNKFVVPVVADGKVFAATTKAARPCRLWGGPAIA